MMGMLAECQDPVGVPFLAPKGVDFLRIYMRSRERQGTKLMDGVVLDRPTPAEAHRKTQDREK